MSSPTCRRQRRGAMSPQLSYERLFKMCIEERKCRRTWGLETSRRRESTRQRLYPRSPRWRRPGIVLLPTKFASMCLCRQRGYSERAQASCRPPRQTCGCGLQNLIDSCVASDTYCILLPSFTVRNPAALVFDDYFRHPSRLSGCSSLPQN